MGPWGNQNISGDKWKQKQNNSKSMRCSKTSSKRKVYSNRSLPQETRKISNNLTLYLKELEKEKQMKLKVIRIKEILKNREEINKRDYFYYTENKGKWMNEIKTWFVEKTSKIDKTLARFTKKKRRAQNNKIRNEKEVTINMTEKQRIISYYYEQLHISKNDNLEEIIEVCNIPRQV